MSARVAVVLPAGGEGRRFGAAKPFVTLAGKPVLLHALAPFLDDLRVEWIVIAVPATVAAAPPEWLARLAPRVRLVPGGRERGDSVRAALDVVPDAADVVLVHDAARPLVTASLVARAIAAAAAGISAIAAIPVTDTIQEVDATGRIVNTPERARLWQAQTPQAFPREVIIDAYRRAEFDGVSATDDAALVLRCGQPVHVVPGERENLKITVPADVALAETLLRQRSN
jgi:2-C-methyl-D-erythritol 4-phosphate cytidylyltransferase